MSYFIQELISKTGETLFNVPAEPATLMEMGFKFEEANQLCKQAITAHQWRVIRRKRDHLISLSDWTQMADSPLSQEKQGAYLLYRQALRDLPQTYNDPNDVVWPIQPE